MLLKLLVFSLKLILLLTEASQGFSEHKQYEELLWWPLQHLFAQYVKAEDAGTGHVRSAHEYRDKAMVAAIKRAERHDWIGGRLIPLPEASIPLSEVSILVITGEGWSADELLLVVSRISSRSHPTKLSAKQSSFVWSTNFFFA